MIDTRLIYEQMVNNNITEKEITKSRGSTTSRETRLYSRCCTSEVYNKGKSTHNTVNSDDISLVAE